jgi:hypothetical protein
MARSLEDENESRRCRVHRNPTPSKPDGYWQIKKPESANKVWLGFGIVAILFLNIFVWLCFSKPGESIPANGQPDGKSELKPAAISPATVSTNPAQTNAASDDDNPATSISIYLNGQTVVQFAEIYKGQPSELAVEASNQIAKHRPKCGVFLFEKAESYYENDATHASSAWRQMRPDYAWALFLAGRDGEAAEQLRKLIADIKTAISNPSSPLTATIITVHEYGSPTINKTLDDNVNFLMKNCNSKPTSIEYIGPMWNEYNLLCFQISTNKF